MSDPKELYAPELEEPCNILTDTIATMMPEFAFTQACRIVIAASANFQKKFGSHKTLLLLEKLTEATKATPVLADNPPPIPMHEVPGEQ